MSAVNRRAFLTGSAALAAGPVLAAPAVRPDFDVVIVGAGAAGIAAARRVAAAGRSYVVLEASDRWGGRCLTDVKTFGIPYERGARWLYMPDRNPMAELAIKTGLNLYAMPAGQRMRIGRRNAREDEMEDFLASLLRCNRTISDASRGKLDVSCAQALPKDLGDWRPTVEFVLGDFGRGKALSDISAMDFARSGGREVAAFCREGLGTLMGKLAFGSPIQFSSPVTRITRLCVVEVAGKLAADVAEEGEAAMTAFAIDWLANLFGSDFKRAIVRTHATRWTKEPWVLGAFSAASPGGHWARTASRNH
jgi:monoamine oxidase